MNPITPPSSLRAPAIRDMEDLICKPMNPTCPCRDIFTFDSISTLRLSPARSRALASPHNCPDNQHSFNRSLHIRRAYGLSGMNNARVSDDSQQPSLNVCSWFQDTKSWWPEAAIRDTDYRPPPSTRCTSATAHSVHQLAIIAVGQ